MSDLPQPEADTVPPPAAFEPDPLGGHDLEPVDAGYASVLRIVTLLNAVPLAIGATAVDLLAIRAADGPVGLLTTAAWLLLLIAVVIMPSRRYARLGYMLGDGELRVARGYFFRVDTIVPFVRVQHIDVGQGPVERRYGLSHLVVHTSGTHNSTVTLPGLPSALAASMRDVIRSHIQSDFA
jgi:membrane protein YdbS with pleckstrin-like domain